jgi:hypothetical protein
VEEYHPRGSPDPTVPLPEQYTSWDEFRSLSPSVERELMHLIARPAPDMHSMSWKAIPEEAPDELTAWGKPVATVAVGDLRRFEQQVAGYLVIVLGALALGAGIYVLQIDAQRATRLAAIAATILSGIGAMVVGARMVFSRGLSRALFWVFEDGVYFRGARHAEHCRWQAVPEYRFYPGARTPTGLLKLPSGRLVALTTANDPWLMPLLEYVETRLCAAQFLPRLQRLYDAARERFGSVVLDRQGIQCGRFAACWADVRRVVGDAQELMIEVSMSPDWARIPKSRVSLPYLVIALAAVMIDEHRRIGHARVVDPPRNG